MVLDLSTTATLLGALTGLFLARLQWARANRPSINFAIVDEQARFLAGSEKWEVWIYNAGPGIAIVEHYSYVIKFADQPRSTPATLDEINRAMEARGLTDGEDYYIREQGLGVVYPAVTSYNDGNLICWFTVKALAELEGFDITVRVSDALGDAHERTLRIYGKMPSLAMKAKTRFLATR